MKMVESRKPVKCIPSVTTTSLLLHGLSFAWSCFGIYKDRTVYIVPSFSEYGGRAQYLTFITAYFCMIANGYSFLIDLLQTLTGVLEKSGTGITNETTTSPLIQLRDHLMSLPMFVLSTFVVFMYWGIALVDLEGVHPLEHRKIVPLFGWYNQYLHTLPLFIAFIQIININYQYCSASKALFFIVSFGVAYICWISHLAKVKGYWAYGIIEKMNDTEFVVFVVICHVMFFSIYLIGRLVSSKIWNKNYRDQLIRAQRRKIK